MNINQILKQLENEPKTNSKIQLLKDNVDNELLKSVCNQSLNPNIKYYINAIPIYESISDELSLDDAIKLLDKLSSRELTGHAGINHLAYILSNVNVDDAEVIKKIIKGDLRCGVNTSTVNKVWKDLIPEYPYMRCSLLKTSDIKKWDWNGGIYSQLKADGRFNNANKTKDGVVELLSRAGQVLPNEKFKNIVNAIEECYDNGTQTHGEFLVKRNGEILDREISNGILNSVAKGGNFEDGDEPIYYVWDQIPLDQLYPGCKINIQYRDRFNNLIRQNRKVSNGSIEIIETRVIHNVDDAINHFESVLELGLEGTVIKNPNMIWEDTTSKGQVKLKLEVDDIDLEIIEFNPGNGKNEKLFGSIKLKSGDELLEVNISGFKDNVRKELYESRESLINTIVTIKSNKLMTPKVEGKLHSLFLPRYKTLRNDKVKADTLPEIQAKFESAIGNIRKYF